MPLTLEDIAAMITSNKEEILNKVDGIVENVNEVKIQVNDLTERANTQEETHVYVNEKLQLLQKQILELKASPTPSFAQVTSISPQPDRNLQPRLTLREAVNEDSSTDIRIRKLLSNGRRVILLSPVDQNDIDIEKEKGIENEEVAMISAAQSFFTEDMNIPASTVAKMKIVKVFKPATADETDRLYVEFAEEQAGTKHCSVVAPLRGTEC